MSYLHKPLFFAVLILVAFPAAATQVQYQTIEQLGASAQDVVRGTVAGSRSYWNEDHSKIFTETTVQVEATYKGMASGTVRIIQMGGVVDNIRVTAHGALAWKPGEEVVLFLEPADAGAFQVSGFSQGKFAVHHDPVSGSLYVVRPNLEGIEVIGAPTDKNAVGEFEKIELESFMNEALGPQRTAKED